MMKGREKIRRSAKKKKKKKASVRTKKLKKQKERGTFWLPPVLQWNGWKLVNPTNFL